MANVTTELKVVVKSIGKGEIDKLSASLTKLGEKAVKPVSNELKNSVAQLKKLSNQSTKTTNNVRGFSTAFKELANNLEFGSKEFKEATAEAKKLDVQLQKMEGRRGARQPGVAGRALRGVGGVTSTALGAGVFGGLEGFAGAVGGGLLGATVGAPIAGAAAGAVAGATVGNLRKQAGGVAELVAQYNSMKIALAGVSESQDDYSKSLQSVTAFSKDFLIPIDQAIGQYTRLKASVVGAGGSTEDTDKAFKGMAAAILATGGNINDFNSALVATAQVFSKGKVSAEELRQQIGERLPGAFTIFADALGISTQELDELLEKGEVRLSSFGDFTQDLFKRYGETSQVLGSAPEKAGQRLQVALIQAAIEFGGFFQKVGAGFQDYVTGLINLAIDNKENLIKIVADVAAFSEEVVFQVKNAAKNIATPFITLFSFFEIKIEDLKKQLGLLFKATKIFGKLVLRADAFDNFQLPDSGRLSVQERSAQIQKELEKLLGEFTPAEFGSGLRDTLSGLDGGIDDPDEQKIVAGKEIVDITQEEFDLRKQIIDARKTDNKIAEIQLSADLKRFEILGAQIGEREKTIRLLEVEQNEAEALGKIYATTIEERIKLLEDQEAAEFRAGKAIADALNKADKNKIETFGESFKEVMQNAYKEATDLGTALGGVAVNAVDGLTDAIVEFATTGKAAFADFARSIISDLAKIFLKAAIFKTLDVAFPGLGLGAADGAAFDRGGQLTKYASGGVVNAPTFFRYQDGGQFKNGVMGEAGPEAILPLKRGSDGKLGVTLNESGMRESMSRYSRGARGGSVIPENGGGGSVMDGGGGAAVAAPIDVRYTVERINSVDYVTADQFQQGMQQAANQGARQGEQQTLKRLQMSSGTRRRLGM